MSRKKHLPFTEEQNILITKWYRYSLSIAYKKAQFPYDHHEVMTAAHDALMTAARYYQPDRGCKSFQSFYIHCLFQKLSRAYHKRLARSLPSLNVDQAESASIREHEISKEYSDHLRQSLPSKYQDVIYQRYDMEMSGREIARATGCHAFKIHQLHADAISIMKRRACI